MSDRDDEALRPAEPAGEIAAGVVVTPAADADREANDDDHETTAGPHRVVLEWGDDRRQALTVPADRTVLDAAETADTALPFGCRTGACATCTARVLAGRLEHRRKPRALKRKHLESGYALLCVAEPRAPTRLRVGSDVHADLTPNPFK